MTMSVNPAPGAHHHHHNGLKELKGVYKNSQETHLRATNRLSYEITQCYLPSHTSERAPP